MEVTLLRKLLRVNIGGKANIFFLFQILGALVAVGLGKLIASKFETTTFGLYALVTSTIGFFSSILGNPISQSYRYAFYQLDLKKILTFYRSLYVYLILFFCIVSLALCSVFNQSLLGLCTYLFFHLLLQVNLDLNLVLVNNRGKNLTYAAYQFVLGLISFLVALVLVLVFKKNAFWVLLVANTLPTLILLVVSSRTTEGVLDFKFIKLSTLLEHEWTKTFYTYIKPLLVVPFFVWIINSFDKYYIGLYFGYSMLALYAAPYGIGAKIFNLLAGSATAYINKSVFTLSQDKTHFTYLWRLTINRLRLYYLGGFTICLALYFLKDFIGYLLLSKQYESSFILIPFLGLAILITSSIFFLEQIVYAINRTEIIAKHFIVGAFVNIVLNLILIPKYNIYGATLAMILSSFIEFFVIFVLLGKTLDNLKNNAA